MPRPAHRLALRPLAGAALALALALGAVACSSDSSDGSSKDDAKATTTTAAKGGKDTTSTTAKPAPEDIEGDAGDYQKALIDSFDPKDQMFTKNQVECLAPKWVAAIGVDTFKEAGITPESIADQTSSIEDLGITESMADGMVDAMGSCELDTQTFLVRVFTSGATLSPSQQSCLEDAITPEAADATLRSMFTGAEPDPALAEAAQACASAGN